MADYQVKAMLNAPSEEGYNQTNDPKTYGDYQILLTAFDNDNMDVLKFVLDNYRYDDGPIEEHPTDADVIVEYNDDGFILLEKIDDAISRANENIEMLVDEVVSLKTMDIGNCFKRTLFDEERDCPDAFSCGRCNHLTKERYRQMLLNKYIVK